MEPKTLGARGGLKLMIMESALILHWLSVATTLKRSEVDEFKPIILEAGTETLVYYPEDPTLVQVLGCRPSDVDDYNW